MISKNVVVGSVKSGLKDFNSIKAKVQEGNGYGLSVHNGKYYLCKVPGTYHRMNYEELNNWQDKYCEHIYDSDDLDEYEQERRAELFCFASPVMDFEEYCKDQKLRDGVDFFVEELSGSWEKILILFGVESGKDVLCIWCPDMENY